MQINVFVFGIVLWAWDPNVDIIEHTKLHLGLVLSIPMPLNAERQVSVVPLIKIAAAFSWLHRSLPGVRGRAQILQFYGKNNKSLKQAIPGNYGHEPTLMTPSSANITTEVDLLIIRADGLLLVKQPLRQGSLVCIRWPFFLQAVIWCWKSGRWCIIAVRPTGGLLHHRATVCADRRHGRGNSFFAALSFITS